MQISFGAKIPISTCNLYDKQAKKFVRATFYEIDCKDKSDADYIRNLPEPWIFRRDFLTAIWRKHYKFSQKRDTQKIYSIEAPNGDIVSMCNTKPYNESINIEYIESAPSKKYKFAGQTMLASIAKQILSERKDLTVKTPACQAIGFYDRVCGFDRDFTKVGFILSKEKIQNFIKRTEEKTESNI